MVVFPVSCSLLTRMLHSAHKKTDSAMEQYFFVEILITTLTTIITTLVNTLVSTPVNTLVSTLVSTLISTHVNTLISTLVNTLVNTLIFGALVFGILSFGILVSGTINVIQAQKLPKDEGVVEIDQKALPTSSLTCRRT